MCKAIKYLYKQINKTNLEDYVIFSLRLKKDILYEKSLSYNKKHKLIKVIYQIQNILNILQKNLQIMIYLLLIMTKLKQHL